jgi:hypothetical protein
MTKKEVEIEERRKTQALAGILTKAGEKSLKTESTVFPKHQETSKLDQNKLY